ncbi:MAG: SAVED domain-containing protein, partial [Mobilitalea sp.]
EVERIDLEGYPKENLSNFYEQNAQKIKDMMESLFRRKSQGELQYLDIFAIAHIPFLFLLGYLVGDRIPCTIHQAQRNQSNPWVWPAIKKTPRPVFSYNIPDQISSDCIALAVNISGSSDSTELTALLPKAQLGVFSVDIPSPSVVDDETVLFDFRRTWMEMMTSIYEKNHYVMLNLFPAVPNSVAIEMGRNIHPHACPPITIWNKIEGQFVNALKFT